MIKRDSVAIAVLLTCAAATSAPAQDTQGSSATGADGLDEIIVTARKREERLQEVPMSVSVFSGDTIDRLNVTSVDELAKLTTGLTFDSDFGRLSDRPIMRGQATILGDSGVSYFIDDVYYTGSLLDFDMETVQSLQVVKGPQSALHGRNTYSGAILITTKAPSQVAKGGVKAEFAQFGHTRVSANWSGPLVSDKLAQCGRRQGTGRAGIAVLFGGAVLDANRKAGPARAFLCQQAGRRSAAAVPATLHG
jgi:iron complex outermembrane recepter protein